MSAERSALNGFRQHFPLFAAKAFNIVNPGQDLIPTAAYGAISHKLAELAQGRIRRLLINVPPRSGKSLLASVALPAFILGCDPTRRLICASYSGELAAKLARDCRTVMQHPSYGHIFPATVIAGKNTENELETAHGGFRYATSVGGTLTGRGGNVIVIDDPMKPDEAMSAAARERVWDWFTGTVSSRLDNKAEDAIVIVMQRLHVDDLSGRLLDQGGWDHLSIPAIAEDEQTLAVANGRSHFRPIGDILDPEREPREVLDELRRELGSTTFEAQYQQQPVPQDGGLFKWSWFKTYNSSPPRGPNDQIVISWDTAMKDRDVNDYSVGVIALKKPDQRLYILDVIRERLDFPSLLRRIQEQSQKHAPATTLMEEAGSGISLLQYLGNTITMIGIRPVGEKIVRFQQITPLIEAGQIHLPNRAVWLDAFKRELLSFPASANDDQVDALSQLLNWVRYYSYQGALTSRYGTR